MKRISKQIESKIQDLMHKGGRALREQRYEQARKALLEAYSLLPEPRNGWDVAELILSSAAEAELALGQHKSALELAKQAANCATADPLGVAMLRGRALLEIGDETGAAAEFLQVLLATGPRGFEEVDRKYYEFAISKLMPPAPLRTWDDYAPPVEMDDQSADDAAADRAMASAGKTELHEAIADKKRKKALALISAGADVNAVWDRDEELRWTPLHEAVAQGDEEVVNALIAKGADPNRTGDGSVAPLHKARSESLVKMLVDAGANIEERDHLDRTPLLFAVDTGAPLAAVRALLESGCDASVRAKNGSTPLDRAKARAEFAPAYAQVVALIEKYLGGKR